MINNDPFMVGALTRLGLMDLINMIIDLREQLKLEREWRRQSDIERGRLTVEVQVLRNQ